MLTIIPTFIDLYCSLPRDLDVTIKMQFVDTRVSYRQTAFSYTIKVFVPCVCQRPSASVYLLSLSIYHKLICCPRILCEFIPMKTQLTQNQNVVIKKQCTLNYFCLQIKIISSRLFEKELLTVYKIFCQRFAQYQTTQKVIYVSLLMCLLILLAS